MSNYATMKAAGLVGDETEHIAQLNEKIAKLEADRIEWHDRYCALYAHVSDEVTMNTRYALWYNQEFKP